MNYFVSPRKHSCVSVKQKPVKAALMTVLPVPNKTLAQTHHHDSFKLHQNFTSQVLNLQLSSIISMQMVDAQNSYYFILSIITDGSVLLYYNPYIRSLRENERLQRRRDKAFLILVAPFCGFLEILCCRSARLRNIKGKVGNWQSVPSKRKLYQFLGLI